MRQHESYKCNVCGCLWEFEYPDFPAKGFVRKFENGKYARTVGAVCLS